MNRLFFRMRRWNALAFAYSCTTIMTMYAAFTVFSLITPDQQTFDLDLQPYVVGLFVFALIIGVQLHWIAKRLSPYPDMPEKNADQHPPGWFAPIWVILKAFRLVLPR